MKNFLHFFGEYLVEGTGGSSVLKTYCSSGDFDQSKPEIFGGLQRQKVIKRPTQLNLDSQRPSVNENIRSINGDNDQRHHKSIKRHRWWNISKVSFIF